MIISEKNSFFEKFIKYSQYLSHNFKFKGERNEVIDQKRDLNLKMYLSKLFLLQLVILYYLQEKKFFNCENNFIFKNYNENKQKYSSFYDYILSFSELLAKNSNDKEDFFFEAKNGIKFKIKVVDKSCLLLNDSEIIKLADKVQLDDDYILTGNSKNNTNKITEEPLLEFLENINWNEFAIIDFIIGDITEHLIDSSSKRSSGSYYTPKATTDYLVTKTLEYYLLEKINGKFKRNFKNIEEFIDVISEEATPNKFIFFLRALAEIKILDPAVGSANMLIEANKILVKYYLQLYNIFKNKTNVGKKLLFENYDDKRIEEIFNTTNINNFKYRIQRQIIFSNSIYGVDINKFAIKIARLRQYLLLIENHFGKQDEIIHSFKDNLIIADFLLEDLSNVCKMDSFDIILTNPPYLGESGSKEYFRILAKALPDYYEGKMDLWYFFAQKSFDLLNKNGFFTVIAPSYWLTAKGAVKLRQRIDKEISLIEYINFGSNSVFMNAKGIHTNIFISKKSSEKNKSFRCINFDKTYKIGTNLIEKLSEQMIFWVYQDHAYYEKWDGYYHFLSQDHQELVNCIINNSKKLEECGFETKQGIITGINKVTKKNFIGNSGNSLFKADMKNIEYGDGVFILNKKHKRDSDILDNLDKLSKLVLRPFYKNSDIKRYFNSIQTDKRLIYVTKGKIMIENYHGIKKHLQKFKELIEKSSINAPYLHRPREELIFTGPKIITAQRSVKPNFSYNNYEWFAAQDIYFIVSIDEEKVAIKKFKALLTVLNSKLADFWFCYMGKRKGKALELFSEPINNFPIKNIFEKDRIIDVLSKLSEFMLFLSYEEHNNKKRYDEINFINDLIDISILEIYLCNKADLIVRIDEIFIDKIINFERWFYLSRKEIISIELSSDESKELDFLKENFSVIIAESCKMVKEDKTINVIRKKLHSSKLIVNLTMLFDK